MIILLFQVENGDLNWIVPDEILNPHHTPKDKVNLTFAGV